MSYNVRGKLQALGITDLQNAGTDYLKTLFTNDELVAYDEFSGNNVQVSKLRNYQCIFLINNQKISSGFKNELASFVKEGGSLVIFPARKVNFEEYNALMSSINGETITVFDTASMGISEINYKHEIYREVFKKQENEADLPVIKGYLNFTNQFQQSETTLLKFRNGKSALGVHPFGNGKVYTFAFPLDKMNFNFVRHVLFVPTVYNMVLNSGEQQKYAYSIENTDPVTLNQNIGTNDLKVINSVTKEEFLAGVRTIGSGKKQLMLDDMPKEAGHYLVLDDGKAIQSISYNFSRKESIPEFLSDSDLDKITKRKEFKQFQVIQSTNEDFSKTLQDLNNGKQLWKYFIMLAIFFLICEMAIIRLWK
jgi:hypothetical protein